MECWKSSKKKMRSCLVLDTVVFCSKEMAGVTSQTPPDMSNTPFYAGSDYSRLMEEIFMCISAKH